MHKISLELKNEIISCLSHFRDHADINKSEWEDLKDLISRIDTLEKISTFNWVEDFLLNKQYNSLILDKGEIKKPGMLSGIDPTSGSKQ